MVKISIPESPCITVCRIEGNLCVGCYRTTDEIERWLSYTDLERTQIMNECNARKKKAVDKPTEML
ncbi:uncharacterized protein METZ01_LOCUS106612 [marine metagenome]|uniref:DUF1289 domain-containing protein n=1 Tax=marine metagenome TaxID=408172 RepID=A0A381WNJ6_9ZZZZ